MSFYSSETGIVFAQERIGSKTNEKPAALELAKSLHLAGAIVTADAMHCEGKFFRELVEGCQADYCVALKANQKNSLLAVEKLFKNTEGLLYTTSTDTAHGRKEIRTTYVQRAELLPEEILKKFHGLIYGTVIKQVSIRSFDDQNKNAEISTRYFVSSLSLDTENIAEHIHQAIREHWHIENKLHHVLDLNFGQDRIQAKNPNYITNLAQLNKFALAVIEVFRRHKAKEGNLKRLPSVSSFKELLSTPEAAAEALRFFIEQSYTNDLLNEGSKITRTPKRS